MKKLAPLRAIRRSVRTMNKPLPQNAEVVIVGGGIIGCSIAYHLTLAGCTDVVLLERKQLTCGTTWHAAGLLTTLRSTENQTMLARYTQDLYRTLEEKTGQATGYMGIGSIQLATTEDRLEEMRRGCDMASCFDVESHEISREEIQKFWPLADVSNVTAGFYFPNDGRANPTDTTQALAKGARNGGAKIFEHTKVEEILVSDGKVTGVVTDRGTIRSERVVNCTGMWARMVGLKNGVNIPLHPAEHYYLITESMEGMHKDLPILRDPDNQSYYREETGKLMLGVFEDTAAPWGHDGIPEQFCFDELPPDWDRLTPYLEKAMERIPAVQDYGIQLLFNGPESFTADHNYLMGEAPEIKNYFVAAGFNSLGILSAGGAGKVMADWIMKGYAPMDCFESDIRRTLPFQNNAKFLQDRIVESLGIDYQYHWPYRQWETARGVKKSPLYDREAANGACFGESAGWERANWYAPEGVAPVYEYSHGRQNWFDYSATEHTSVRSNVGIFEQSSFSKIYVQGKDAVRMLNRISSVEMDIAPANAVYTLWLNGRATVEAELVVMRLEEDRYMVIAPAFAHTHVYYWMKQHIEPGEHVVLTDVTASMGMLSIQGPKSRDFLQSLTDTDLSDAAAPAKSLTWLDLHYFRVMACRLSYVDGLGYELYVPSEFLQQTYDLLTDKGRAVNLKHCGYHALNSLRIEKAIREFGHDVGPDESPREAGMMFAVDRKKAGGFIGQEALEQRIADGLPKKRIAQFILEDPDPLMHHNEIIFRNGDIAGYITSASYGHSLGAAVGLGYVNCPDGVDAAYINAGDYTIRIAGRDYAAKVSTKPLLNPKW